MVLGLYIFFMLTTILLTVYVFPFRSMLWNRWKLKIKGKAFTPVLIVYNNNTIDEIVVNTSDEKFTHNEAAYNIQKKFLAMLLQPDKFLGLNMDDVRTHAVVSKISSIYIQLLQEQGASVSLTDALNEE